MARWQVTRFGQPTTHPLQSDGLTTPPMQAGFTRENAMNTTAALLSISIGGFATITLALNFLGYDCNYVDDRAS